MSLLRSVLYNIHYVLWTILVAGLCLPTLLRPGKVSFAVPHLWCRGLVWGARLICGIRWRVEGLENLPKGPVILISKHQSAWETLFLPMLVPKPVFILKKELLSIPFVGWYMAKTGMIAVDRKAGASAMKTMLRGADGAMEEGRQIIIFPEGTRVAVGSNHDYQPGVAALYARFGGRIPMIPVALNTGLVWGRNSFIKRPGMVVVRIMPPLEPGLDKKAFTAHLKTLIDGESDRLCGLSPPTTQDAATE